MIISKIRKIKNQKDAKFKKIVTTITILSQQQYYSSNIMWGSGTRLWPLSRKSFQQYLSFMSKNNKFAPEIYKEYLLENIMNVFICNEDIDLLLQNKWEINIQSIHNFLNHLKEILICYNSCSLNSYSKIWDLIILIWSSDQVVIIQNYWSHKKGIDYAELGKLVTFGVVLHHLILDMVT